MREQQNGRRSVPVMAWLFTASLALLPQLSLAGPMDLGGHFAVSDSGAATYGIPLQVPPGTAGIEPKLALTYNSQSGNGLLGVGWSLSGLSAITRCPRTMAQDGYRGSVNFDTNDRYCLDGQRLMVISGTDGGDGAEYRTERESFSKIVSYGTAGNGPAWFKVWTKGGQILEYGNTGDSRIEAVKAPGAVATWPTGTVRAWAQNRLSDTTGNYYTVTYTEDAANGDYYPQRIDYTGNSSSGLAPIGSVQFGYEDRPDLMPSYYSGALIRSQKRLTKIASYAGESLVVGEFRIDYAATSANYSKIARIAQCDPSGTCERSVSTTWSSDTHAYATARQQTIKGSFVSNHEVNSPEDPAYQGYQTLIGDVSGDGKADLLALHAGIDFEARAMLGNGNGAYQAVVLNSFGAVYPSTQGTYYPSISDINGDGRGDVVWIHSGTYGILIYTALSNGNGTFQKLLLSRPYTSRVGPGVSVSDRLLVSIDDVNGDGKVDVVVVDSARTVYTALGNGSGSFQAATLSKPFTASSSGDHSVFANDVNGDGKADIILVHAGSNGIVAYPALSSGNGTFQTAPKRPLLATSLGATGNYLPFLSDVNGDGNADIVAVHAGKSGIVSYVCLSNGDGSLQPAKRSQPLTTGLAGTYTSFVSDVNSDGKADIVVAGLGGFFEYTTLSNGDGTFETTKKVSVSTALPPGGTSAASVNDINGSGKAGIVWVFPQTSRIDMFTAPATGAIGGQLLGVQPALGEATTWSYKPLTDASLYSQGAATAYPIRSLRIPMYVASTVTSSNGLGGTVTTNYKYGGLKAEVGTGRGLLGFNWIESTQVETGVTTRTTNRQDWPYVGLPSEVKKTQSSASGPNKQISLMTATYGCHNPQDGSACTIAAGKRYLPYASQSIESNWDLNGATLPVITRTQTVDLYGNPTVSTISTNDGYSTSTTNTYQNDTTNWYLGRLLRTQVQSTTP